MSRNYQRVPTADDPLHSNESIDLQAGHAAAATASPLPPHASHPHTINRQRTDLEETFGEPLDDDDDFDDSNESRHLLGTASASSSSSSTAIPVQPPPPPHPSTNHRQQHHQPAVLPVTNDGVFANMSAKPEREADKLDETPPAYEDAAADATPPYWQTTIVAPAGMDDMILVEGMPVGSLFGFAWNLLVSASFQFVGFLLTYLLHTSHAAKQGSRAGLGITLVQFGFYIRSRGSLEDVGLDDGSNRNQDQEPEEESVQANIIAYLLMLLGWFIIIRSIGDYLRARKMERIIATEPSAENMV
ncbi:metal homeostatis protein bsd2 [Lichtheimia corymbifera JMRC:FSU:9682]|uniref:Metal homeostatis protein bsd2 n=1 Tax=Lichtheimia corymbifera JMRC:FSU:9682 TaxID=1263082 RepID=A0A068RW86_9FUNG|nr:metal homeostatis protein bsd2 [Lichtheimia corymbifera JMRC:FSU:9682]